MTELVLVTIIAEETLAVFIENDITDLGAKGFTATTVSGKGLHGKRDNQWEGENIKIETVVSKEICDKIFGHLQHSYFDRYPMIAFSHPVQVVRTNHFL